MKKIVLIFVLACTIMASIFSLSTAFVKDYGVKSTPIKPYKAPSGSNEELYQDIFLTLLEPQIYKAIDNYYGKMYDYENWGSEILSIERPNGDRTEFFIIKLQVNPYIGAYNTVGTDNITLNVSAGGNVKIMKFEHIKSYPVPPWLR